MGNARVLVNCLYCNGFRTAERNCISAGYSRSICPSKRSEFHLFCTETLKFIVDLLMCFPRTLQILRTVL